MTSTDTFNAARALLDQAHRESVAERAASEVRLAKLRAVLALEAAGREDEVRRLLAEVQAEQEEGRPE